MLQEIEQLEYRDWEASPSDTEALGYYAFWLETSADSVCMTSVSIRSVDSDCSQTADSRWLDSEVEVAGMLARRFASIPEVDSIFLKFLDNEFLVWTILDSYNREARDRVYDKEIEICDILKLRDFDFRATSRELMSPDELEQAGYHRIFSRR